MTASGELELARSAVAVHRWREACERFELARSSDAGGLSAPDLELLSTASFLRGRTQPAVEALTTAHDLYLASDDAVGAARTAGWIALELLEIGDAVQCGSWVARGLRLVERLGAGAPAGGLLALLPAALTALFMGELTEAIRRLDGIAQIAERAGDRELAAYAALGRGKCLTTMGRTAEGFASLDRAMAAVIAGDVSPITTCSMYRVVLDVWHEGFDLGRATTWTSNFARWCREQPELVAYSGQAHAYRAQLLLLRGQWAEASSAIESAEESLRAGDFTAAYVANYQRAEYHRLRGEFRAAEEAYRRAAQAGWDPQPGLALLESARGEAEAAQTMIRHVAGGVDEATRRRLLPALLDIELGAGDVVAARQAADELVALHLSAPTPMLAAIAALGEARVLLAEGDTTGAIETARAASTAWSELGAPYEAARCVVLEARILRQLGELDAAAADLEAARAVFVGLGARPALDELGALTGRRLTGSLTVREVEVLRLVSTGLTNRGIAQRLSLSEKTVARHLSNIFGKLGLSSRAAATSYAYENGLI